MIKRNEVRQRNKEYKTKKKISFSSVGPGPGTEPQNKRTLKE